MTSMLVLLAAITGGLSVYGALTNETPFFVALNAASCIACVAALVVRGQLFKL